ncbi:hypothetical protein DITRI_Ditri06bG0111300 [Diplodiscus trichospermus]
MSNSKNGEPVRVVDHFRYAMFCLLVLMCFGDKLNQEQIREIENVQRRLLIGVVGRFNVLNFWPKLTRVLLRKHWKEFLRVVDEQEKLLVRLIRSRKEVEERLNRQEKRKLTEEEIVSLSCEFLDAGTDTTSTALQWIMANMVKYPHVQDKLFMEIKQVLRAGEEEIKEDDLQKIPYLKAVILEGLRRHPTWTFCSASYSEMGWDPKVWEDPMTFKPERFLTNDKNSGEVFDITGSREIKMMPFGVGRRICPGLGLAMLHLEYFVANLVWNFEWKAIDGDEVNLEEKPEFTVVMKTPLQAHIYPRKR